MRLIKYINEEKLVSDIPEGDGKILEIIKKECSEILNVYRKTNRLLYRGLKNYDDKKQISDNIYKIKPRADRKPKDTNIIHQTIIDNFFYKEFGWKPRSDGVFATQTKAITGLYGYKGIFLPVNGYKYLWSKKYKDLYSDFFEHLPSIIYDPASVDGHWEVKGDKQHKHYDRPSDYTGFQKLLKISDLSITIKTATDGIVIFDYIPNMTKEEYSKSNMDKIQNAVYTYKDNGIENYMDRNDSEIMFKCDYYYWIKSTQGKFYNTLEDIGLE